MVYPAPLELAYTTDGDRPVQLDLYLPPSHDPKTLHKTFLYFHGGGLTTGAKDSLLPVTIMKHLSGLGYVFISPDYHLLPEATGWDIRSDVAALELWLQSHAAEYGIDLSRLAIAGGSAGAYVAMTAIDEWKTLKPKVFVDQFGMIDIASEWYTKKKEAGKTLFGGQAPLDEVKEEWFEEVFRPGKEKVWNDPIQLEGLQTRWGLFLYFLREGLVLDIITGHWKVGGNSGPRPGGDENKLIPLENVGKGFPPTVIIHGVLDSVIPIDGSHRLVEKLRENDVEVELLPVEGAEHGLLPVPEREEYGQIVKFVQKHVG